jgi:GDP-L-fucose synthase
VHDYSCLELHQTTILKPFRAEFLQSWVGRELLYVKQDFTKNMATCAPYDVVLVTGANGMVGSCVQDYVNAANLSTDGRRWVFVASKDTDLRDWGVVEALFKKHKPTHVLHCAARLASAADMTARPVDFWMDNVQINNNVLRAAHLCKSKVVSVLSTVMFSKDATFPVQGTPEDIFGGQLHEVSQSYGFAKRALAHLSQWYRKQHGCKFSCILPSNIFGPYGAFETKAAPLLNALIAKAEASRKSGTAMTVMGTGAPMRQMMYARDLARMLVWALDNFDDDVPLIVAGDEVAVRDLAEMACDAVGCTSGLQLDLSFPDGPLRRTADTSQFAKLCPEHKSTPLNEAIRDTAKWYLMDKSGRNIADAAHVRDQM